MMFAIVAGIGLLCSCTKVKEKSFIGTWRVLSCQANEGYGWYELMEDGENRTITFYEDGTYVDIDVVFDDVYRDNGTWAYMSSYGQLRLFETLWDVTFHNKNEMELNCEWLMDGDQISERIIMKKNS